MYYLVIVQNDNTPAIFGYESYDAALSAFHTEMAYRAEDRNSTKCIIVNSELVTLAREIYVKEIAPVSDSTEEPIEG